MPVPINKYSETLHSQNWVSGLRKTMDRQTGVNNQIFKGKVSSRYARTMCSTISLGRRNSDGLAIGYHCDSSFGVSVMDLDHASYGPINNRAYSNFKEAATGSQSQVGTAFAEWRQTLDLVTSSALSIRNNWNAFKRGRWARYTDIRINPRRRTGRLNGFPRSIAEQASQAWLTWWFGVAPLMGDVTTSLEQASDQIPSNENYEGSARTTFDRLQTGSPKVRAVGTYRVATGARVRISNPNLYLASQLGLVNPVSVAWEIIPFSFVADWAFDVSSFLGSFSDFVGCSIEMPYTSKIAKGTVEVSGASYFSGSWKARQMSMTRVASILRPTPNFEVRANLGNSITRAASATSLLIQALRGRG